MKFFRNILLSLFLLSSISFNSQVLGNKILISQEEADIPDNLIHYYKLDTDSDDSIGINHGMDNDITYVSGKINNAASFNGSSSWIKFFIDLLDPAVTDRFSFSLFVKLDNTSGEQRTVSLNFNTDHAYTSLRLNEGGTANRIGVFVYDGVDATLKTVDGYTLTDWTHIVVTAVENDRYDMYINGNLEVSDTNFGDFTQVGTDGNILGASRGKNSNYVDGLIDGFGIWNKALTQTEVTTIYNIQNGGEDLVD